MLVLARKRNEALVIDGSIRIEVLRLAGGVARLRFTTPKSIPVMRGVARAGDPSAVEAINGGIDTSGMGIVDLTLGVQQVVTVGEDIHVGLVDVTGSRALLFIDAAHEVSVDADGSLKRETKARRDKDDGVGQGLLPFPLTLGPEPEPEPIDRRAESDTRGPERDHGHDHEDGMPRTLPFLKPREA